jgi:hypothetical protein
MPERCFPPPWTVEEYRGLSYIVRDANNFAVAYVYFESKPGRRAAAVLMTKEEARKVAAGIAHCQSYRAAGMALKLRDKSSPSKKKGSTSKHHKRLSLTGTEGFPTARCRCCINSSECREVPPNNDWCDP